MNAADVLKYGHATFTKSLEGVPQSEWGTGGVCGVWSVKDIIGHMGYIEVMLVEVLATAINPDIETPMLDKYEELGPRKMNDVEADLRQSWSIDQLLNEYNDAYVRVAELAPQISAEKWRQVGTIPWYGLEYSLEDFIVYAYYGHKREHSAQINVFKDSLAS